MKAWIAAALLAGCAAAGAAESPVSQPADPGAPAQPITLGQAIALALQTSPRLEVARAGAYAARAQFGQAKSQGQPSVQANVNARIQGPKVSIGFPGVPAGALPGGGVFTPPYAIEPQLQASVPLYTGGRVSSGKRAARHAEVAAAQRVEAEAQGVVLDVTAAYLDTLEARQQLDLQSVLRGLNRERLDVARVRQRAGAGIPLEVSQSEADLAQSVQREIEARARLLQSGASLNTLIGRPAAAALVIAPLPATMPPAPIPSAKGEPLTAEQVRELGLERPDLKALREDVRRAEAQVDVARAQRRPLVSLSGSLLGRIPETLLGGWAYSLGATLVQSLFDGGRSRAQVDAARAERDRSSGTLRASEQKVEAQVEQARVALDAAEQRLAAEDRRVSAAAEALEVARTRLRAGTVAPVEVTEAETTLARAQTDALTARFEAARARVQLAYAVGLAYPEAVAGGGQKATSGGGR